MPHSSIESPFVLHLLFGHGVPKGSIVGLIDCDSRGVTQSSIVCLLVLLFAIGHGVPQSSIVGLLVYDSRGVLLDSIVGPFVFYLLLVMEYHRALLWGLLYCRGVPESSTMGHRMPKKDPVIYLNIILRVMEYPRGLS